METMDQADQLMIRACKQDKHVLRRLRRLYRRFYLGRDQVDGFLAGVMMRLADRYLHLKPSELVHAFDPEEAWRFGIEENDSHDVRTIKILSCKIMLAHRDRFPGLQLPAALRRRQVN